jgi:hypothetical protein
MALIVVKVELQSALERKKDKVIVSLDFNGRKLGEIEYSQFQGERTIGRRGLWI